MLLMHVYLFRAHGCVCTWVYMGVSGYMDLCVCQRGHLYVYMPMYIGLCLSLWIYVFIGIQSKIWMHVSFRVFTHAHMNMCVCVSVNLCV